MSKQRQVKPIQSADQASGTREIFCQGKGRTCLRGCKGAIQIPKNTIPRAAKTDSKTEYAVRAGESHSG